MDSITQVMCQEENIQNLDLAKIRRATSLVWEQRQGKKAPPWNTNKLSAVKHSPNEPPFEQQQGVRATLPPSTLFADRALLHREYSISEPKALVETVSKYKGLH